MKKFFKEAVSFLVDPDARKTSIHSFDNGNAMSVREAKVRGLKETVDVNFVAEIYVLDHAPNASYEEVNQCLLDYFKGLTLKEYRPDFLYHGGHHDPSIPVKGALWFHLEKDIHIAESYMNWGDSENPKLKKTLLKAKPAKTLKLLEFPGNHVEILKNIYGKPWSHAQLAKDVTIIGEPNILSIDGFYRPRTDEYFIINVQNNLIFTSKP